MKNRYISRSCEKLYTYESDLKTEEIHDELRQIEQMCPDISEEEEEEEEELESACNVKSKRQLNRVKGKLTGLKKI
jgi:hypothetical protein